MPLLPLDFAADKIEPQDTGTFATKVFSMQQKLDTFTGQINTEIAVITDARDAALAAASAAADDTAALLVGTFNTAVSDAQNAATSSSDSALASQAFATNPEDVEVTAGFYSALHYSLKAAATLVEVQAFAGGTAYLLKDDNLAGLTNKTASRASLEVDSSTEVDAKIANASFVPSQAQIMAYF